MSKILSVGLDPGLMDTRQKVLERTGATVINSRPELAFRLIEERHFALVVVCHTVSEHETLRICHSMERRGPHSNIVVLWKQDRSLPDCERIRPFELQRGPGALVELVAEILNTSGFYSTERRRRVQRIQAA